MEKTREFSLLKEPWIKVIDQNLKEKEVSLTDIFAHGHEYRRLAGETPEQDAAMLRLLISVTITALYRYRADGKADPIDRDCGYDDVMERVRQYMEKGQFPKALQTYLKDHENEFWLIHPTNPFFQCAGLDNLMPDDAKATKIKSLYEMINIQSVTENEDTATWFTMSTKKGLSSISYAEAARWLVFYQSYAHTLKEYKGCPVEAKNFTVNGKQAGIGLGRAGKLLLLMAEGDSLFDQVMFNLCALKDGRDTWGEPRPAWEQVPCSTQARYIPVPDNIPELYTMQTRRALIHVKNGRVTGLKTMWGDYTAPDDGSTPEQMAIWKPVKKEIKPMDPNAAFNALRTDALWKEFSSIATLRDSESAKIPLPGTIAWLRTLSMEKLYPHSMMMIYSIGHEYSGQVAFRSFGTVVEDRLSVAADILLHADSEWIQKITDEIDRCCRRPDTKAKILPGCGVLVSRMSVRGSADSDRLMKDYYAAIDAPFREWLATIDTKRPAEEKSLEWEKESVEIAREIVDSYISSTMTIGDRPEYGSGATSGTPIALALARKHKNFILGLKTIYPDLYKDKKEETADEHEQEK